ncbi:MAG TPA: hypothetical protein VKH42_18315 [Vicinamibacterales bacterium]|nr:hypothetical protein [Vicinamibacterales bacterium]
MRSVLVALVLAFLAATPAPARAELNPHPSTTPTIAATTYALQQNPVKDVNVDINVNHGGRAWYRNPMWIAIAAIGGVLLIVLILLAFRGTGSGGGTTIIRE